MNEAPLEYAESQEPGDERTTTMIQIRFGIAHPFDELSLLRFECHCGRSAFFFAIRSLISRACASFREKSLSSEVI